jgi:hypothetical protein
MSHALLVRQDRTGVCAVRIGHAWCPELKGCHSQGRTLDEAIADIREAIELYLETLTEEERHPLLASRS